MRNYLKKGQTIIIGNREFRIEDCLTNRDVQLHDVATKEHFTQPLDALILQLFDGNLKILDDNGSYAGKKAANILAADFTQLPEELRSEARRRYAYVMEAMNQNVDKRTANAFIPAIHAVSRASGDQNPPSGISVYRWHRDYISSGENIRSLVPMGNKKGNRKSRNSPDVLRIIDAVISEKFLTEQRLSVRAVYDAVIVRVDQENKFRDAGDRLAIPDYTTVYRWTKKLDPYEVTKARRGKRVADAKFKQLKTGVKPTRPLERVEIDHTKLDLLVIDAERGMPIGRPWLTTAIDVHTKAIFGIYLSFTPPSYLSVMQCLLHGIKPKAYVRQRFPNIHNSWDAYGLPEVVVVDNGKEFHSTHFEDACLQLGIIIQYAPVRLPWYKGSIERFFGALNKQLLHLQPGTTFSNIFEKADYDPKENAVIDFFTLEQIMHKWIVDVYHQQEHRGIRNTPARAWKVGVEQFPPALPSNAGEIDVLLGMVEERRISPSGIELHGLLYNDDNLAAIKRSNEKGKVKIKFDPTDLSMIYVFEGFKNAFMPVASVNPSYTEGLSLWQHNVIRRFARLELGGHIDSIALVRARGEINEIVGSFWRGTGKNRTRVKAARFLGIGQEKYKVIPGEEQNEVETPPLHNAGNSLIAGSGQTFDGISDFKGISNNSGSPVEGRIITPEEENPSRKPDRKGSSSGSKKREGKVDLAEKKRQQKAVGLKETDDGELDTTGFMAAYKLADIRRN